MSSKDPVSVVRIKFPNHTAYFVLDEKKKLWVPLDEAYLSRASPGYTQLNEKARLKERESFIKHSEILQTFKVPDIFPNAPFKPRLEKLPPEEQVDAIQTFLSIGAFFESPKAGYYLMTDILCGLHCQALRNAEPSFHPAIAIRSDSYEVQSVFNQVMKTTIRFSQLRWGKNIKIRRKAMLDYHAEPGGDPHHIQDFSQCRCSIDEYGYKPLRFPMAYTNSVALVIGADASQIREATPYLDNTAVIFLNSESGDFKPTKLSPADCAAYDPELASQLKASRKRIGALLNWWGRPFEKESKWAAQIVQKARASFGKPDSRYIRVKLDPKLLRDKIRYEVFLSFLDALEYCGYLSHEDLEPYRQEAKEVFDPAPPEPVTIRHAEDPAVFIEVMRALAVEKAEAIVDEGNRVVKREKPLGAWRTISGQRYLVLLEDTWAREYKKAVKARKDVDASCCELNDWVLEFLKLLAADGYIKHMGKNPRYRYDLFENGTRDDTYVVAIPAELLDPDGKTQGNPADPAAT